MEDPAIKLSRRCRSVAGWERNAERARGRYHHQVRNVNLSKLGFNSGVLQSDSVSLYSLLSITAGYELCRWFGYILAISQVSTVGLG